MLSSKRPWLLCTWGAATGLKPALPALLLLQRSRGDEARSPLDSGKWHQPVGKGSAW